VPFFLEKVRQFCGRRSLAGAVDSRHQNNFRTIGEWSETRISQRQNLFNMLLNDANDLFGADIWSHLQRFYDLQGHWNSNVSPNQALLELVPVDGFAGKPVEKIFKKAKSHEEFAVSGWLLTADGARRLVLSQQLTANRKLLTVNLSTCQLVAVLSGRFKSSFTRSSTPFTNFPDSSVPNFLAISIASLIATMGGTSLQKSIS